MVFVLKVACDGCQRCTLTEYDVDLTESFSSASSSRMAGPAPYRIIQKDVCHPAPGGVFMLVS